MRGPVRQSVLTVLFIVLTVTWIELTDLLTVLYPQVVFQRRALGHGRMGDPVQQQRRDCRVDCPIHHVDFLVYR